MSQSADAGLKPWDGTWVCVADARRARLVRCGASAAGRCTVEECSEIRIDPTDRAHRRSSPRSGWTGGGQDPQNGYADQDRMRFARIVVEWLRHKVRGCGATQLAFVAPPRFLGALRRARAAHLAPSIEERAADLAQLSACALADHPVIQELAGLRSVVHAQA